MNSILYLCIGLALGGIIGWLFGQRHSVLVPSDDRLESELRQNLAASEQQSTAFRNQLDAVRTEVAEAQAFKTAAEQRLEEQRADHEKSMQDAKAAQEKALLDLRETFTALSANALDEMQPKFLRLAEQRFEKLQESAGNDLEKRQEAIKTLVDPLEKQLKAYQEQLQQASISQADTLGKVKEQIESLTLQNKALADETQQFRMVLHSSQARGRWGEETLRRVVEAAGMSAHCDFTEQAQAGDNRPDLIVKLPGDRVIIVDAKVPDLDFFDGVDEADPSKRSQALAAHATKLKGTIRALAERDYPRQFPAALDYVVLFMPAESLFSAALEGDHDLIVWAASKKIMLATPASLIALLRSVSMSWQQNAQQENAVAIAEAAQELFTRVTAFIGHFEKMRAGLDKVNGAFNDAIGSYERSVRPQHERLQKLGAGVAGKEIAEVKMLDTKLKEPPVSIAIA